MSKWVVTTQIDVVDVDDIVVVVVGSKKCKVKSINDMCMYHFYDINNGS